MIWIVAANSNMCRIYHFDKHPKKITLLKEISHPENRLKTSDITSDKPGKYKNDGSAGGAYSSHTDPKAVEIDNFSREIAQALNHGRNSNAYKNIILVTPSHMDGLISKHLDKHVKELVTDKIQKDIMQLSEHDLLDFVIKNLQH